MTRLLIPGLTCASVHETPASGLLVDGHDFYKAIYEACVRAERSILMAGWQFASKVALVRGDEANGCELPTHLVAMLAELCERKPQLEVHLLAWDASAVFAFERVPLQWLLFKLRGHERIHYKMDNAHPTGASHHQKLIVVDRAIAFVGGMDVCNSRWDAREHRVDDPRRENGSSAYDPYHDVQAYVTGDAVDVLRGWFCERWQRATGSQLVLPDVPRAEVPVAASLEVSAPCIGLARTLPRTEDPPASPVHELFELHLRAIAAAERSIYIENQYLSCDEIGRALEQRMERGGELDIVIVLPEKSAGFKERISIGIYQQRILARLEAVAERTGHHLGVYYSAAAGDGEETAVFIHSKVLAVDDRFVLVSSANTSNRSMGFDTELGLAWESAEPTDALRAVRVDLLAEHCGLAPDKATALLASTHGLVERLDALAAAKLHRLRLHRRNVDEKPGWLLSKLIPDENPFDPDDPRAFAEALPEPGVWLDRFLREPLSLLRAAGPRRPKLGSRGAKSPRR